MALLRRRSKTLNYDWDTLQMKGHGDKLSRKPLISKSVLVNITPRGIGNFL